MARNRFVRRDSGEVDVRLTADERESLASFAGQLRSLLVDGHEPDLRRLFPVAYPNDAERQDEYRALVNDDLLRLRLDRVEALESSIEESTVSSDTFESWLGVLSDLRLVLGTRLDVSEDDEFDPDADDAPSRALYLWLGLLQEEMVAVLMDGIDRA